MHRVDQRGHGAAQRDVSEPSLQNPDVAGTRIRTIVIEDGESSAGLSDYVGPAEEHVE